MFSTASASSAPAAKQPLALLWLGAAAIAALLLYVGLVSGPQARAAAAQQRMEEIAAESRAFCEKLGMPAGTQGHAACTAGLADIRASQDRRSAADMHGML